MKWLYVILTLTTAYLYGFIYEKLLRSYDINGYVANIMFKALFFPILLILINYYNLKGKESIFDFPFPTEHILQIAVQLYYLWISSLLLYILLFIAEKKAIITVEISFLIPFILYFIIFLWILIPNSYQTIKTYFIESLFRIISSPFSTIYIQDIYFADQFCSINEFLYQLQFSICLFAMDEGSEFSKFCHVYIHSSVPFFSAFPFMLRMLQCIRKYYDQPIFSDLLNSLKYLLSFVIFILAFVMEDNYYLRLTWFLIKFSLTFFRIYWDVKMDWMYPLPLYIYISNIILRFSWLFIFAFHMYNNSIVLNFWMDSISALIELLRRFIWNHYHLEKLNKFNLT